MAHFIGEVLSRWLPNEKRKIELLAPVIFIDDKNNEWLAPKGSIVDGASIPRIFWLFIGSPFIGKYRRASVVHDVYCVTKSKPHNEVHKMFYDALIVDGVSKFKARLMYRAVKLGGPKWK